MNPSDEVRSSDVLLDDPRILGAMQEYLDLLDQGIAPVRREFVRQFPEIAEPLDRCLAGLELVHQAASPGAPSPANEQPPAGQPLGDFRIVRELGRGGMGIVYEAVQRSLGRRVALKLLPFAAAFDPRHLKRFQEDAQAAAQLEHPNIVPIYAIGVDHGVHFYAMQLIQGHSLARIIRELRVLAGKATSASVAERPGNSTTVIYDPCPFVDVPKESLVEEEPIAQSIAKGPASRRGGVSFRRAAELAIQAADALEFAHQNGIVHRGIKPSNLLVEPQGRLWIADFGLAQLQTGGAVPQSGEFIGMLAAMSPEQASGNCAAIDPRTDIYSLGATLYELIVLEPIFSGTTRQELLTRISNEEPRSPRSIDPSIPVELETIVLKAIAKNPAERYATAKEMSVDLRRFLDDQPILSRRPGRVDRARQWARRHPAIVNSAIVVLVLSAIGLLLGL